MKSFEHVSRLLCACAAPFQDMPPLQRGLLALVVVLHLGLGAALGLSVDEAHYALYAAHPALSYFDHPPLVGWVQWPLVVLGAPDALLRLIPGALWLITVVLIYGVTLQWKAFVGASAQVARSAAIWAVWLAMLAPLLHILGVALVPDTLLMPLHLAVMGQTLRILAHGSQPVQRLQPWLVLGLLLGLAGLSKYTAIFSAVAVAVCLIRAYGRGLLVQRGPWLALLVAVAVASPVAIWNAQHGWISFTYQAQHGAGGSWSALHVGRFALVQILAYGPLLLLGGLGLAGLPGRGRWPVAFFVLPMGVLATLSGGGTSLPHWTAPAWVAFMPLAGMALAAMQAHRRTWLQVVVAFQLLCCLVPPALMLSGGMPFMAGQRASAESTDPPNPFADLHGWQLAGAHARQLAQERGIGSVSVQNWTLASRMGWYARPLPVHVLENRFDQFDLWAGDLPAGGRTLLVDWSLMPYVIPLGTNGFDRCTPLATDTFHHWTYALAQFRYFDCEGWSGVPAPRLLPKAADTPSTEPGSTP